MPNPTKQNFPLCHRFLPFLALLVAFIQFFSLSPVQASGYHPTLERAWDESSIIALGKIVEAWDIVEKGSDSQHSKFGCLPSSGRGYKMIDGCPTDTITIPVPRRLPSSGRGYKMIVQECFKGGLKNGDELLFCDPHHNSTAGYYAAVNENIVVCLVPHKISDFQKETFDWRGASSYHIIRTTTDHCDLWKIKDEVAILELLVSHRGESIFELIKEKVPQWNQEKRWSLSNELIRFLPWNHSEDPQFLCALLGQALDSSASGWFVYTTAYRIKDGAMPSELISKILRSYDFDTKRIEINTKTIVIKMQINSKNISQFQQQLVEILSDEKIINLDSSGENEKATISKLSELCPDFFREELQKRDFPERIVLQSLKALKIDGSAIKKPELDSTAKLSDTALDHLDTIRKGIDFRISMDARHCLSNPQNCMTEKSVQAWKEVFPLLDFVWQGANTPVRKALIRLYRTMGYDLQTDGKLRSTAQIPPPLKLKVTLEKLSFRFNEDILLTVTEIENDHDLYFSRDGLYEIEVGGKQSTIFSGDNHYTRIREDSIEYLKMKEGRESSVTRTFSSSSGLEPGDYHVRVMKQYDRDGSEKKLDAWTGMIISAPVDFIITK